MPLGSTREGERWARSQETSPFAPPNDPRGRARWRGREAAPIRLHSRARSASAPESGAFVSPSPIALRVALPLLILGSVAVCLGALLLGAVAITPGDVFSAVILGEGPYTDIIRQLRVPRVLLAFAVGGALAVAGGTLQAVVGNPLAEPWLLGLSGGASLGAVIAVVIGLPAGWSVAAFATIGALLAIAIVYRVAIVAGGRLDPRVLLLAGVVTGVFATALSSAILMVADPFTFRAATLWLFGGFAGASWSGVTQFALTAIPGLLLLGWLSRPLDLIALGDETATTLGADVMKVRRLAILAAAILTAATVAVCGVIGFVGLVVPHALRWMVGSLHRNLLPAVFLAGGTFTVFADALARSVLAPAELQVGVVTALIGVPLFAILMRRSAA
jgi:iron complex transport system permease protein